METSQYSCVFWSKDESDADLTDMAQRSAHVPGVTDTASSRKKTAQLHLSSVHSLHTKQKLNMHQSLKKKELASVLKSSMTSENPTKKDDKQSAAGDPPSLKDLRPEDKKRVANLIRELAKTGEEKEVAKEQLEVERRENEMKTKNLQNQIEAILRERETIQQQYLECQKLLSTYQSKVSEEQRNLSGSLHDGSSQKGNKPNDGWSPIKESARTLSPTLYQHASKKGQEFMELQSVPIPSSEDMRHRNGKEFVAPPGPRQGNGVSSEQQSHSTHHSISARQFSPPLSSTHRAHHRSRVPSAGTEGARTASSDNKVNGFSSTHKHEQSKQSDSHDLPKAHGSQRNGSRTSQETFLPLTEVTDDSTGAHLHTVKRKGSESRKSSDRNSWVSLPEMDGHVPSSYELHHRGQGQNETSYLNGSQHHVRSLPASMSDAKFSRQRRHFEGVASSQYGNDYQTRIHAEHQEHIRSNGRRTPNYDFETHQERQDYRNLTPEQRQQQLGSLKKKLQQEQGWLQRKLQEQEQLLYYKRLEIQRQKEDLSQLDDTGYEQVRRKYLGKERSAEQYRTRTGVGDEYRTGFVAMNDGIQEDGYHHQRLVPEGGMNEVTLPWQQNVPLDEENLISTNYPPEDFREGDRQGMTGRRTGDRFDHYRQRHVVDYDEDSDIHYQDNYDDGDEVDDDETWYEMRQETEGADNRGSIQGYASLHPQQDGRQGALHKSATTNPATFQSYQSYPTSGLGDTVNGVDVRLNRGYPSRISEPQKQFGNITALLEEESLAGLSLNGSNPPYARPGAITTPMRKANIRPHLSHQFPTHTQRQGESRTHPSSPDHLREREKVTMELYTPQSGQGKNQRLTTHPSAGQDITYPTDGKRTNQGYLYSYTDPAKDDALHAHLVQRSHQVIQEIGMLLNQSAEMGEEEESKVLEDVFFLK